jgi:hypothetical protein
MGNNEFPVTKTTFGVAPVLTKDDPLALAGYKAWLVCRLIYECVFLVCATVVILAIRSAF